MCNRHFESFMSMETLIAKLMLVFFFELSWWNIVAKNLFVLLVFYAIFGSHKFWKTRNSRKNVNKIKILKKKLFAYRKRKKKLEFKLHGNESFRCRANKNVKRLLLKLSQRGARNLVGKKKAGRKIPCEGHTDFYACIRN